MQLHINLYQSWNSFIIIFLPYSTIVSYLRLNDGFWHIAPTSRIVILNDEAISYSLW